MKYHGRNKVLDLQVMSALRGRPDGWAELEAKRVRMAPDVNIQLITTREQMETMAFKEPRTMPLFIPAKSPYEVLFQSSTKVPASIVEFLGSLNDAFQIQVQDFGKVEGVDDDYIAPVIKSVSS